MKSIQIKTPSGDIRITKQMQVILSRLEAGQGNAAIAQALELSEHTVKAHCWRLYTRIGVKSRTQAVAWWRQHRPGDSMGALVRAVGAMLAALSVDGGEFSGELKQLEAAYKNVKGVVSDTH